MKVILHIGMGKTGTSSIQQALSAAPDTLKAQRCMYLGMWLDRIDPRYVGHGGIRAFFEENREKMDVRASDFFSSLMRVSNQEEIDSFIISNEAFFAYANEFAPFVIALKELCDLQVVAYMRNPMDWLESAYTQWGLFHKQNTGPIVPFKDRAPYLMGQYEAIRVWHRDFKKELCVRRFEKGIDVVDDFANAVGLKIPGIQKRALERTEKAEIVFRALYNDRFNPPILPERFEAAVLNTSKRKPWRLDDAIALCFGFEGAVEAVENRRSLFEFIERELGLSLLQHTQGVSRGTDDQEIRNRILDFLVEINLQQAERISFLERKFVELSKPK